MIRLSLYVLLACICAVVHPSAASAGDEVAETASNELFAKGYQLFVGGKFEAAAGIFQRILRADAGHLSARNYLKESLHLLARMDPERRSPQVEASEEDAPEDAREQPEPSRQETGGSRAKPTYTKVTRERSRSSHNPRGDGKGSIALGILGPTLGLGVAVQARPHWAVSVGGGMGGFVVIQGGEESGLLAVYGEAQVLPIPWRVTPVFGVGLSVLVGSFVPQVAARGVAGAGQGLGRVLPYIVMGVRYDAPFGLWVSGGIGIVPSIVVSDGEGVPSALPIPGFRLGVNL